MITVGIICEYNPFHSGHAYQIETVRKGFGPDCAVIAIMSGNFVQRGEAALLDKWSRARTALLCGVNLVIELPAAYATGSAERFADGGVALAAACGLCDYLVFGSESGDLAALDAIAEVLAFEPDSYRKHLRSFLDEGFSFPASRVKALERHDPSLQASSLLGSSNNILAIEYLKAMRRRGITGMKPFTVRREGQGYLDISTEPADESSGDDIPGFQSACAIRNIVALCAIRNIAARFAIRNIAARCAIPSATAGIIRMLADSMPTASLAILADRFHRGECIADQEVFAPAVFAQLRSLPLAKMADIPGMNEGLAERLKEYSGRTRDLSCALSSLVTDVSTKRHPQTRVRRCLLHMLLGLETADFDLFDNKKGPFYLRILGFDKKGQYLLKLMKKSSSLPILMKGSDFLEYPNNQENLAIRRMAELDCIATDLWMFRIGVGPGRDYTAQPVTLPKQSGGTVAS